MGWMFKLSSKIYHLAANSCLHTLPHGGCFPAPPQTPCAPKHAAERTLAVYWERLAVIFSLSESVWQLETLNSNSMPFSLSFINSSKMLHLLSLPILVSLQQKGGSLSLNWVSLLHTQLHHLVCFTHCSVIWQQSWVQANLRLQYNGFFVFCNAEYTTCRWNRSPPSHCLPSPCKKDKKQQKERDHSHFYIAAFVASPSRAHNSLLCC